MRTQMFANNFKIITIVLVTIIKIQMHNHSIHNKKMIENLEDLKYSCNNTHE